MSTEGTASGHHDHHGAHGHDDAHTPGGHADSAGIPWEGREFHANPAADDDGSADPGLVEAIRRFRVGELGAPEVVDAVREARLLVPLVTVAGDEGLSPLGHRVDKTQELSLVTLEGPDRRTVIPAFSSVQAMSVWNPTARPVPVEAPRVGLAAASEGADAIILDPGSETEFAIRRTAYRSLALGAQWWPAWVDSAVLDSFFASIAEEPAVHSVGLAPGDPDARLRGPEVEIRLVLEPGLTEEELGALLLRLQQRWAVDEIIAERVDSISLKLDQR